MPSHRIHRAVSKLLLGRDYPEVDRLLDLPALALGRRHRVALHDPATAWLVGYMAAGGEGGLAALLHILVDSAFTAHNDRRRRRNP